METERSNESDGSAASRRDVLRAAATGAAAAGVAAGATGTAAAQEGTKTASGEPKFGGWMSNARNYDGEVVDKTGQDSVTITVGAASGISFGPAAVRVDPGTTITWKWSGKGGQHNVVGKNRDFRSGDPVSDQGTTFEQSFDEKGVVKYYCNPHKNAGMVGAVVVGDVSLGSGGHGGGGEHGGGKLVLTDGLLAVGAAIVLGVLSPILFAIHLSLNSDEVGGAGSSGDSDLKRIDSQED